MTNKIYKSAQGKVVDLGALILENESVRAVGNMNVNARGDLLDSANRVIETKNKRVQKQYSKQVKHQNIPVSTGTVAARQQKAQKQDEALLQEVFEEPVIEEVVVEEPTVEQTATVEKELVGPGSQEEAREAIHRGGLAAAIARSREVKQELEKTPRQRQQESGLKKI